MGNPPICQRGAPIAPRLDAAKRGKGAGYETFGGMAQAPRGAAEP
jgi:hypothetical protein